MHNVLAVMSRLSLANGHLFGVREAWRRLNPDVLSDLAVKLSADTRARPRRETIMTRKW
jgi:hypothetical protein